MDSDLARRIAAWHALEAKAHADGHGTNIVDLLTAAEHAAKAQAYTDQDEVTPESIVCNEVHQQAPLTHYRVAELPALELLNQRMREAVESSQRNSNKDVEPQQQQQQEAAAGCQS